MADTKDLEDDLLDYEPVEDEETLDKPTASAADTKKGHYVGLQSSTFKDFLLKPAILRAVTDCGFEHPSEVQQYCIPQATLGIDLLCQAKAGMGKTAVFVLSTLHLIDFDESHTACVVMVNTREMAIQIQKEYLRFTKFIPEAVVSVLIGGIPKAAQKEEIEKKNPHIIIGTPGRMSEFARTGVMKLDQVKFFVMDECDKLLDNADMRGDIQQIFLKTPHEKQVMMFSATMPDEVRVLARKFMSPDAAQILIDNENDLVLHGLQQFYIKVSEAEKTRKLTDLLDSIDFNQLIIFVSKQNRAKELCNLLKESNFPAVCMHARLKQTERTELYKLFKDNKARIMVSTDLLGRGIDVERVNVVINYDFPIDGDTYIHRVGRAGRFGTNGLAISMVASDDDVKLFDEVKAKFSVDIGELPDSIDTSTYMRES